MRRDWAENLYPGAGFARGRQLLEDHLVAMLDLDDGSPPLVSLNGALIEDSQRTLARLSVAERRRGRCDRPKVARIGVGSSRDA